MLQKITSWAKNVVEVKAMIRVKLSHFSIMKKPPEPRDSLPPMGEIPSIADLLPKLIALRGIGRIRGDRDLLEAWRTVAPDEVASGSRPTTIRNGVLTVVVTSSALLGEVVSFHKAGLLSRLKTQFPHLRIRDLKFKLQGRDGLADR